MQRDTIDPLEEETEDVPTTESSYNLQPTDFSNYKKVGPKNYSILIIGIIFVLGGISFFTYEMLTKTATSSIEFDIVEMSIESLQAGLSSGQFTSVDLVNKYLERIKTYDPLVHSIIEINPDALNIARQLDLERQTQGPRGPLHGIPILLKDNIDTADTMQTTAGSLALFGLPSLQDSTTAQRLRAAGAIILGKTNLSEFANFRGFKSTSGWSGRGGQTRNPYALDRNPSGSSSGSAVAAAASFCSVSIGTETDGSIVSPSTYNGIVGLKPTVGLTSRAGVIPISTSQDSVGIHGRSVADVATTLGVLTGIDERDPATFNSNEKFFTDYRIFLNSSSLIGARIGIPRQGYFGYSSITDIIVNETIQKLREAGAIIIDPADLPNPNIVAGDASEITVLLYEFKDGMNSYLKTRTGIPVSTLSDIITFNRLHSDQELIYFQQEILEEAETYGNLTETNYLTALNTSRSLSREQGIDAVLKQYNLDALLAPTSSPATLIDLVNGDYGLGSCSSPSAMAGYPIITLPVGYSFSLPVGVSFMGTAYSEPTLLSLAYALEQLLDIRKPPTFASTVPLS